MSQREPGGGPPRFPTGHPTPCGRAYLSSTEVRLSISVMTSAISYFSLCGKRRTDAEAWQGAGGPFPSSAGRRGAVRGCSPGPPGRHGPGQTCTYGFRGALLVGAARRGGKKCCDLSPLARGSEASTRQVPECVCVCVCACMCVCVYEREKSGDPGGMSRGPVIKKVSAQHPPALIGVQGRK